MSTLYWILSFFLFIFNLFTISYLYLTLPVKKTGLSCHGCGSAIGWRDFLIQSKCFHCYGRLNFDGYIIFGILAISQIYIAFTAVTLSALVQNSLIIAYFTLIFMIDFRTHYIFHITTAFGLFFALLIAVINDKLIPSLLGAGMGFLLMYIFYLLGLAYTKFKNRKKPNQEQLEDALGFGDVTLSTVIGAFTTSQFVIQALISGILLAGFVSILLIIRMLFQKNYSDLFIAYGPYLILGSLPYILF